MWILLLASIGLAVGCASAESQAAATNIVGEFSNVRTTQEHAYGYTVQLWREQNVLFGFFMASDGLAGDTPTGIIENVRFDAHSGRFSFNAKLTTGIQYLGNKPEPSRDFFEFEGTLKHETIVGP